jgi:hypothetical protein
LSSYKAYLPAKEDLKSDLTCNNDNKATIRGRGKIIALSSTQYDLNCLDIVQLNAIYRTLRLFSITIFNLKLD